MKYYLDTNVFLRFLVADDAKVYESCRELFGLIDSSCIKAVTSPLVFAEIVWVLGSFYKFPREKITETLRIAAQSGILFDNRCNVAAAVEAYGSHTVKFVDALIASHPLIRSGKLPVISYDADFDKLHVKRLEPRDVIARVAK